MKFKIIETIKGKDKLLEEAEFPNIEGARIRALTLKNISVVEQPEVSKKPGGGEVKYVSN